MPMTNSAVAPCGSAIALAGATKHYRDMTMARVGLYLLMMAVTAAATYVGSRIAGPVGAVIGAVAGVGVSALGEVGRQWLDSRESRRRLRQRVFLPPTADGPSLPAPTPAAMLVPEREIVPFTGREQEVKNLVDWCSHWNSDPLRLLLGVGGSGKTRLAREVVARLSDWECGWVRAGEEVDALNAVNRRKSLIIVDYAETRPRANLARLVRHLAWPPDQKGIRVLFIARTGGDWWSELSEKADSLQERSILAKAIHVQLGALNCDDSSFAQHYQAALTAFSKELGTSQALAGEPPLNHDAPILVLHVAALVAVLGPVGLPTEEYDQLLAHEDRYWQRSAESCDLDLSRTARRQSVAELSLSGAAALADVAEQLERVPDLAEASAAKRRAVARWLRELYPEDGPDGLSSLRPHLLAEHLVVRELADDKAFSAGALRSLSPDSAHRAFAMLGLAAEHDQRASQLIAEAVEADPGQMILPAVSAVVETGVPVDATLAAQVQAAHLNLRELARVSAAIPAKSRSLDRTATVVRNKLIEVGTAELQRTKKDTSNLADIWQRQTELMELARVNRIFQEQGRILPGSVRKQLLNALKGQERALTDFGQLSEAQDVSMQIAWINSHRPAR